MSIIVNKQASCTASSNRNNSGISDYARNTTEIAERVPIGPAAALAIFIQSIQVNNTDDYIYKNTAVCSLDLQFFAVVLWH